MSYRSSSSQPPHARAQPELPVSIDRVERDQIQVGQLEEICLNPWPVPGVSVEMRQNYAQDLQISVRGFGARSSFGVRACGCMPTAFRARCRMAGAVLQFDLGSADHIEVLRGPFSRSMVIPLAV